MQLAVKSGTFAPLVMPGLVPGIHVFLPRPGKTWMAGTSQDKPGHDEHTFRVWVIFS
jgi:hypothetical protein